MMSVVARLWKAVTAVAPVTFGAMVLAASPAAAACPDAASAAKGFKLTHASGRFLEVIRIDGDVVHSREQVGPSAAMVRDTTSLRGLVALTSEGAGEKQEIVWSRSPAAIFPLQAGTVHELDYVVKSSKGTVRQARYRLEVGKALVGLAIGPCGYEVWPLKRENVFVDTGMKLLATDYWSPALSVHLRRDTEVHMPGKEPSNFSLTYDAIETRP